MTSPDQELDQRAAAIRLMLFDVDGVLTDGLVTIHDDGHESKNFFIRDGIALVWAQRAGIKVGLLSARLSATTPHRAAQLGISLVYHGVSSKLATYERILVEHGLSHHEVAFMGDDVVDLAVLTRVGLACAPADCVPEVRSRVHLVTSAPGGAGAAREVVERVLRVQGKWDAIVDAYLNEAGHAESNHA